MANYPAIIDLFSGGGGFSLGAHQAGFRTLGAIELDPTLSYGYRRNFPNVRLVNSDIRAVNARFFSRSLPKHELAGVVGGPPCQGFSTIGKRDIRDPRNELVWQFFRFVRELQPHFFVMENVPGILDWPYRGLLEEAVSTVAGTYSIVGPIRLDAHRLGAATKRQRVIIIGYRPDHVTRMSEKEIIGLRGKQAVTSDAILDLPSPSHHDAAELSTKAMSTYSKKARRPPPLDLLDQDGRAFYGSRMVTGFRTTRHSNAVVRRFEAVLPGDTDPISRFPRLRWDAPCPTLRAGTGPDVGSFQAVRPIHPSEPRVITVREAARLQGFPDWFNFHPTKWHSFRMIGNSVSPYLAEKLLRYVLSHTYNQTGLNSAKAG